MDEWGSTLAGQFPGPAAVPVWATPLLAWLPLRLISGAPGSEGKLDGELIGEDLVSFEMVFIVSGISAVSIDTDVCGELWEAPYHQKNRVLYEKKMLESARIEHKHSYSIFSKQTTTLSV